MRIHRHTWISVCVCMHNDQKLSLFEGAIFHVASTVSNDALLMGEY